LKQSFHRNKGAAKIPGEFTGGLIESGAGTLVLTSQNSYSGTTTVLGGTLELTSANAIPAGGTLVIDSSAAVPLGVSTAASPQVAQVATSASASTVLPTPVAVSDGSNSLVSDSESTMVAVDAPVVAASSVAVSVSPVVVPRQSKRTATPSDTALASIPLFPTIKKSSLSSSSHGVTGLTATLRQGLPSAGLAVTWAQPSQQTLADLQAKHRIAVANAMVDLVLTQWNS